MSYRKQLVLLIAVFCLVATNGAASVVQSEIQEPSFTRAFMSLKISDQLSVELRAIRRKDTPDKLDQFARFHVVTRYEMTDTKTNEDIFEYRIVRSFEGIRPSLSLTPMVDRGSPVIMLDYKAGANQTVFEFASIVRQELTFSNGAKVASNIGAIEFVGDNGFIITDVINSASNPEARKILEEYKLRTPDYRFAPIGFTQKQRPKAE